jgi:endonuclease G
MANANELESRAINLPGGIPDEVVARAEQPSAPERPEAASALSLVSRVGFLSDGGAQPSKAELERLMGTNDLVDEFYLERALLAAKPVCRVSIRAPSGHERGCATGFMVSPRLMLTNHHVLGSADEAAPSIAEFNFRFDVAGRPEPSHCFRLRPDLFFFNHEALDFALVSVEAVSTDGKAELRDFGFHRLIAESGKALLNEWMTIVQHPGGARRQFAIRENQCVADTDPDVIWYASDTAQGSSGSPVLNDSFQVVALHHAGVPRQDSARQYVLKSGRTVPDLNGVDDSDVDWIANAGIRVSRICATVKEQAQERGGHLAELKEAMQGGDVLATAYARAAAPRETGTAVPDADPGGVAGNGVAAGGPGRIVLGSLVLELNGGLLGIPSTASRAIPAPAPAPPPAPMDGDSGAAESFKEPVVDTDYASRTGFDTDFLGLRTPLPELADPSLAAAMHDGRTVIPYEHFSVVLHRERRLAIFTASNVDGSAAAKRPEAGRKYTREALTGLTSSQMEKWVLDPRLPEAAQIPDAFYTRDNGAFDKGHVVRREDVCFGTSFAQVQRANGDTFHVTNCSPQRGGFNQSGKGGIWGGLENFIAAQADDERLCLFAGPVLADDDKLFPGPHRVRIPTRFWKVVCARKSSRLQVFAFVLEQDVSDLPVEFAVTAEWKARQVSLRDLEKLVRFVRFPTVYHTADQGKAKKVAVKHLTV